MAKKLFIPGPVDVRPDVLAHMADPMIGHRGREASALYGSIAEKMQQLMFTKNTILLSTSSGSGLMEAAIRCCTRKRAAVFSVGSFGDRWYEMACDNGVPADLFQVEPGQATQPEDVAAALETGRYDVVTITHNETSSGVTNPCAEIGEVMRRFPEVCYLIDAVSSLGGVKIDVDGWGVDVCITSAQKCLGLPPGLAICSFSDKAYAAARQVKQRGFYFDLVQMTDKVKKNGQYTSTPSLPHYFALDYQLDWILNHEGLENRFARHAALCRIVQNWAQKHFDLFAAEGCRSQTVTCVRNTRNIQVAELVREMGSRGFNLANGYGPYKEKTFRIAHMGDLTEAGLCEFLDTIDDVLGLEAKS